MGVQARIVLYARSEATAQRAAKAALRRIAELDDAMSDYKASSELRRLCAQAGQGPVRVSADLFDVLTRAADLAELTGGAFDATVGPLVSLWRTARRTGAMPNEAELAAARALVGRESMVLRPAGRTVELLKEGMRLDLGGIAKGYACSSALMVLQRHGVRSALVEMGGDIALGARPPGRSGWTIEIPNAGSEGIAELTLERCGISSSGDTEQYVMLGGIRYSHIVDPRTGLGVTSRIAVTVVARDAATSDGLSTALSVLDETEGRTLAKRYRAKHCFIRTAQ